MSTGMRYAQGRGVAEDESSAVQWLQAAAAQGHAQAQFNLGMCAVFVTRLTSQYWSLIAEC
jgi:TPR repeat protein